MTDAALRKIQKDRRHRLHVHPRHLDSSFKAAFKELAQTFLESPVAIPNRLASLTMSGVITEGILIFDEAVSFAVACEAAVRAERSAYVGYLGVSKRPRCVEISAITARLLEDSPPVKSGPEDAVRIVAEWLDQQSTPEVARLRMRGATTLQIFIRGAEAFWQEHLPAQLHADSLGALSIVPVPLTAIARQVSKAPLRRLRGDDDDSGWQTRCAAALQDCDSAGGSNVADQIGPVLAETPIGSSGAHRRDQLDRLGPMIDIASGDAVGMLHLLFGIGLLTVGTVRAAQPSVSIQVRYFSEIVRVTGQDPWRAARLPNMSASERTTTYGEWIPKGKDAKDTSAALSALDRFLVLEFDIEPARVPHRDWEPVNWANPRYLGPHERKQMTWSIPGAARTPAIQSVAKVLMEVAEQRPIRPSDLIDITLEDIHIYRDEGKLVLDVHRRRGRLGQKTVAAAHPHEFKDLSLVPELIGHVEWRLSRGETLDSPAWGSTIKESRRTFQEACALISRLAKAVTGDPLASFYSLRHSCFSEQIAAALMPGAHSSDPRRLDRIAAEGGHEESTTSVIWYFHLPMSVVRAHADQALEKLLSPIAASKWAKVTPGAIHQRHSRAKDTGRLPKVEAIAASVDVSRLRCVTELHPCQPMPTLDQRRPDYSLADVTSALEYVDWVREEKKADAAEFSFSEWESAIDAKRRELLPQFEDPVRVVQIEQPKLTALRRFFSLQGLGALAREACQEWTARAFAGYVDVSTHEALNCWLRLFEHVGVPASRIQIRLVEPTVEDVERMQERFAAVMHARPAIDSCEAGYKRPIAYLQISSQDIAHGRTLPPAAGNMSGFNGLMAAACIRIALVDRNRTERESA